VRMVLIGVILVAVGGSGAQRPQPEGRAAACTNHPSAEITAHDCRCQLVDGRSTEEECTKVPESVNRDTENRCQVYCRARDCHCVPDCEEWQPERP
jgi:hypothetical protein